MKKMNEGKQENSYQRKNESTVEGRNEEMEKERKGDGGRVRVEMRERKRRRYRR